MRFTQINLRNMRRSPALTERIRELSEKLEIQYPRVMKCRVAVEAATQRPRKGRAYRVSVNVHLPGQDLVSNHREDEDVYVAVREAFAAIERQLQPDNPRR
jgi:ribosomal subunit interface protein